MTLAVLLGNIGNDSLVGATVLASVSHCGGCAYAGCHG